MLAKSSVRLPNKSEAAVKLQYFSHPSDLVLYWTISEVFLQHFSIEQETNIILQKLSKPENNMYRR